VSDPFELKIFFPQGDPNGVRTIKPFFEKQNVKIFRRDLNPSLRANFVLANGTMSSNQSGEGNIRRALPGQLFYTPHKGCEYFVFSSSNVETDRPLADEHTFSLKYTYALN
jgi:hypothetical protein